MSLLDRYISAIGEQLPRKSRIDIETEIRSILEDMLEEKSILLGRPIDDEMIMDLLNAYGSPEKVAATYLPEKYLIGPKLYPSFSLVLKIVVAVMTGVALLGFSVRFGMSELDLNSFWNQVVQSTTEYVIGLISAFGNIVLVFAILEMVVPSSKIRNESIEMDWNTDHLMKEKDPDTVNTRGAIATILFTLAALLIVNFYPQLLGIWFLKAGRWESIPLFSHAFFQLVPWLNTIWILEIFMQTVLIQRNIRTTFILWFEIGLKILGIAIFYLMLRGPSILNLSVDNLSNISISVNLASSLVKVLNVLVIIALINAIIVGVYGIGKNCYRLFFKKAPRILIIKR